VSLTEAVRWRNRLAKLGTIASILFLAAVIDDVGARFGQPANLMRVLPGVSVEIDGPLEEEVKRLEDLTYTADSDLLHVTFLSTHPGFWFGGFRWNGTLAVSSEITPGEYSLTVSSMGKPARKPSSTFEVRVYPDAESYRRGSRSLLMRHLALPSWWVIGCCVPLIGFAFASVFILSRRIEELMAQSGRAVVYRVRETSAGREISFGLGVRQGIRAGMRVMLLNEAEQALGTVEVREATDTDALAVVPLEQEVRPGYIVST
jgi:hypothetical protein